MNIATATRTPTHTASKVEMQKITKAAQDFEAVLLNSLFTSLEKTFGSVPGETPDSDPGSDNYHAIAMQALSKGLAGSRGLGISEMITHSLLKQQGLSHPSEPTPKGFPSLCRSNEVTEDWAQKK